MLTEIGRQELEQTLENMSMHGAKVEDLNRVRLNYENAVSTEQKIVKEDIRLIEATGGTIEKVK